MQRQNFFIAGAGTVAAIAFTAKTGGESASAGPSQVDSDADVWRVRGRLGGMIDQLGGLESDYNGNRAAAITALQAAKSSLDGAVSVRGMNDRLSDAVIRAGLEETAEMIKRLSGDLGDYNGQKQAAIDKLNVAQTSLQAALRH